MSQRKFLFKMFIKRYTYKKKTAVKAKTPYKKKYSSYKKPSVYTVKKIVKQQIARAIENKTVQYYAYDTKLYNTGHVNFPTYNIFPLGVDPGALVISSGTAQGQRIGNVIKTKKLIFKGTFTPAVYDIITNPAPQPLQLKMFIFYDKTNPDDLPNPTAANDFFQNGSTTKGFQNDLVDMWSPVNTDRYRILASRTFKLGMAIHTGSGANGTISNSANNDFKYNCNFSLNLTKHYPMNVKFNDTSSVPTTRGLFCMIVYANAQGNAVPYGTIAANVQYMLDYQYEDA